MLFQAPMGSAEEIASGEIWPGKWMDATPYLTSYALGFHTGADLNLNYPDWDGDCIPLSLPSARARLPMPNSTPKKFGEKSL